MNNFKPIRIDSVFESELRADARVEVFNALNKAMKHRKSEGLLGKDLAEAISKDPAYVSRALKGSQAIEFETLFLFLTALGYAIDVDITPIEDIDPSNYDARPTDELMSCIITQKYNSPQAGRIENMNLIYSNPIEGNQFIFSNTSNLSSRVKNLKVDVKVDV